MPKTYSVTGINLKGMPLGEHDRLITVLTREMGLVRVVAPGVRRHQSKLGGRSELFVVNHLLISTGRSLDKIVQAETLESFPGLSRDLKKLTAGQYLAELALGQALSDHPQDELFDLLVEHLGRIAVSPNTVTLASLTHGIFHLLTLVGLSPQVQLCCITQQPLQPNFSQPGWQVGFSPAAGGIVQLDATFQLGERGTGLASRSPTPRSNRRPHRTAAIAPVNALELAVLQQLCQPHLLDATGRLTAAPDLAVLQQPIPPSVWLSLERLLRQYIQYQLERPIRSATLIDTCFAAVPS
jgi:DNA repair protein RecO (recombination protein O)